MSLKLVHTNMCGNSILILITKKIIYAQVVVNLSEMFHTLAKQQSRTCCWTL